jgi:hypothetical protein
MENGGADGCFLKLVERVGGLYLSLVVGLNCFLFAKFCVKFCVCKFMSGFGSKCQS